MGVAIYIYIYIILFIYNHIYIDGDVSKQMSSYLEGIYIHKSHLIWLTHSHIECCTSILYTCTDSCICTFAFQFVLRHARIFLDINSMRILKLLHAHALACMCKWACMYTVRGVFVFAVCLSSKQQPSTINTSEVQTYDHTMPTCVQVGGQNLAISPDQNAKLETSSACSAWDVPHGFKSWEAQRQFSLIMSYERKCPKEIQ